MNVFVVKCFWPSTAKLLASMLLLFTVVLLSGCISSHSTLNTEDPQVFRMNIATEPPSLDSMEVIDLVSITVLNQVMRGLTQYGHNQSIVPAYAESWDQLNEGTTYVFHLRKDGQWQDGKPVTAHDFYYGWQRVLNPDNGAPYAFLLFTLKNAEAFYKGDIDSFEQVGVKVLDDYTLRVDLQKPYAYFLQIMAFATALPQRQDVIEAHDNTFKDARHFMSNGPYTLDQWRHDDYIFLKPNPKYFNGAPNNHGVAMVMVPEPNTSLMMYENNELDFVETGNSMPIKEVRRLKDRPDYYHDTLFGIAYLGFNTTKPPFDQPKVRQAFTQAVDKTFFPKIFQGGQVAFQSFIAPGLFGYNADAGLPFDVASAKKALADAGYPNGKGFPTIDLVYANSSPENRQISEILQYQWKKNLNVPVNLSGVEWKVYLKQLQQDPPHIYRLQWFVDYPDPDSFMALFHSNNGNNFTRWSDTTYDRWVVDAATELDKTHRQQLYDQAQQKLLVEDTVIAPLFVMGKNYLLSPRVKGFYLDKLNIINLEPVHF